MSPFPAIWDIANNCTWEHLVNTVTLFNSRQFGKEQCSKGKATETNNDWRFEVLTALVMLKVMLCHWASRAFHLHVNLGLLDPSDEGCLIFLNARSYLPNNAASYPTWLDLSAINKILYCATGSLGLCAQSAPRYCRILRLLSKTKNISLFLYSLYVKQFQCFVAVPNLRFIQIIYNSWFHTSQRIQPVSIINTNWLRLLGKLLWNLGRVMCGQNAKFLHVSVHTVPQCVSCYSTYCTTLCFMLQYILFTATAVPQCVSCYSMHYLQCVNKTHKYIPSQKKINYICAMQNF